MAEEIACEQHYVAAPSRGRVCRLVVHVLSPGRFHYHSIAIFASRSQLGAPVALAGQGAGRLRNASATGAFGLKAELAELGDQAVAMVALDLDAALLDGATGAAELLQPCSELIEL